MIKTINASVVTPEMRDAAWSKCSESIWSEELTDMIRAALEAAPEVKAEPVGWIRAIDEALVCHHIDVANADDSYAIAKDKLNCLLTCVQDIGGYFAEKQMTADVVERIKALPRIYNPIAVSLDDVIALIEEAK